MKKDLLELILQCKSEISNGHLTKCSTLKNRALPIPNFDIFLHAAILKCSKVQALTRIKLYIQKAFILIKIGSANWL